MKTVLLITCLLCSTAYADNDINVQIHCQPPVASYFVKYCENKMNQASEQSNNDLYNVVGTLTNGHQSDILGYGVYELQNANDPTQVTVIVDSITKQLGTSTKDYSFLKHEVKYTWKLSSDVATKLGLDYNSINEVCIVIKEYPSLAGITTKSMLFYFGKT